MNNKFNETQRQKKYPFIVLEGLSGSGKSIIAELLALETGGIVITSSSQFVSYIRAVLGQDQNLNERFVYYLLGNIHCSEVAKYQRLFCPVICDRYVYSTVAMHTLLGVPATIDISSLRLLNPDVSFFLLVSDEDERRKRVDSQNRKNKYNKIQENDDFRQRYIEYFRSIDNFVFIETVGRSTADVLFEIKKFISKKCSTLSLKGDL